jgi:uncharacterized protein YbjT (DUF2867 family)
MAFVRNQEKRIKTNMLPDYKTACVFGGSGFVGRQVVRELARRGYIIKVATRAPEKAYFLKTAGNVGQIVPLACDYSDAASLQKAVRGCDVVINCTGILFEKGKNTFQRVHVDAPKAIAKACQDEKVARFVHLSALGCDLSLSQYGKSKRTGEASIFGVNPTATIVRPAVIFGAEDEFFNMFARLSMVSPVLPLIGGGKTKMQPIYVGDVAKAVAVILGHDQTAGKTFELGGPEILTFKDIYARLFAHTRRPRCLVTMPWGLAKAQGSILSILPNPLLTADQVESLKTDSVVGPQALSLKDLGIEAEGMDAILPTYLARYRPGGRFGDKKRA